MNGWPLRREKTKSYRYRKAEGWRPDVNKLATGSASRGTDLMSIFRPPGKRATFRANDKTKESCFQNVTIESKRQTHEGYSGSY